jgi:alkyl hydroperoxide reductase subunit AhpC
MSLRINDTIPDLMVETDEGKFTLHEFVGDNWTILFSHPKDFTPVCTTEFGAVAQLSSEWQKRGTKVIGVSVDSAEDHRKWKGDIYLPDGRTPADSATVRSVFIIGPDKQLKLTMTYPMTVGRNFAEVLRALDALQTSVANNVATPVNWQVGDDIIIPTAVSDEDAKAKFGDFKTLTPYLRKAKLPS